MSYPLKIWKITPFWKIKETARHSMFDKNSMQLTVPMCILVCEGNSNFDSKYIWYCTFQSDNRARSVRTLQTSVTT